MSFAEKIRHDRKTSGITQLELAQKIGCHMNTISDWERGENQPGDIHLIAAAEQALDQLPGTYFKELTYPVRAQVRHRPARVVTVAQGHEASTVSV